MASPGTLTRPAGPAGVLDEPKIELVRAAYRLIGAQGVHRVSLEEVAAAAGVSKSLILYHFKTRENLLLEMMRWVLEQVAARIARAVASAPTPEAKVSAMLDTIFAGAESNRRYHLTYLELVEHAARLERFGRLGATLHEVQDATYAAVVTAGVETGAFRPCDPVETAIVLRGLVEGLFLQWLQDPGWRTSHARYRALAEQAVLTYLRP